MASKQPRGLKSAQCTLDGSRYVSGIQATPWRCKAGEGSHLPLPRDSEAMLQGVEREGTHQAAAVRRIIVLA